ncbi:tubulin polymerization-promoting family protein (macronuclear) [Tetrahymena thermophila SB210]|uniref:Tubulin polymerization-promoting family protein n=1 Tax=Tetrahymena thermophila (strain SB210) TaxID=312017 RepID=Q244Y3_TETTS|nr:tubulin polymerization-promoting family protein [Tetrahymena thermophila SB210]EAS03354.1 tubulin polymerization-promoting family protein [Tetrahymena thermophila SB210]|eukprot:XP_001023599.1 tubulin polymerization-promoting family protein [Tetrahymena thermophila SB210]
MNSSLEGVFKKFTGGKIEMDGKTFAKFAKDTGLLDKKLTATDVDLIFAKVKGSSAIRCINIRQFEEGINQFAAKKGISAQDLREKVTASNGPSYSGTKADAVRFHDDKSLYTGVYANGGPSTIDIGSGKISDISQLCDRTSADVRGVKH